mmetsp:Transcript_28098/g.41694  ORF Transcript_28098/g.41694 Transcript_28098/m.41694 type:complete len:415 (+) Transcript_28098:426-1670(+)
MDPYRKSHVIPKSDLEESTYNALTEETAEVALTNIGNALAQASNLLDDLEENGMLGTAIRRFASDLADSVGKVATDLNHGDDTDSRKWARALLADAQSQLGLEESHQHSVTSAEEIIQKASPAVEMTAAKAMSELSEDDLMNAMTVARTILLDVEDALRSISEDDAEEIADVGLTVAKMFLWGLQNVHGQVTPDMMTNDTARSAASMDIEILDDEGEQSPSIGTENDSGGCSGQEQRRFRILWPPIGPAVGSAASWGKDNALQNPILSIALAMTLWPAALIAAFIGGPIIAADFCLQKSYDAVKDKPVMEAAEVSAANVYQVGKFYFLVSKLMVKQSIRVGKRQIKRRGGLQQVARDVGDWTVDRALHPIESGKMLWNSTKWTCGKLADGISFARDAATREVRIDGSVARDGLY